MEGGEQYSQMKDENEDDGASEVPRDLPGGFCSTDTRFLGFGDLFKQSYLVSTVLELGWIAVKAIVLPCWPSFLSKSSNLRALHFSEVSIRLEPM